MLEHLLTDENRVATYALPSLLFLDRTVLLFLKKKKRKKRLKRNRSEENIPLNNDANLRDDTDVDTDANVDLDIRVLINIRATSGCPRSTLEKQVDIANFRKIC